MAIWAYVGLPRQGKSYNVVADQIIPALKQGRRVVTNIPLVEGEIRKRGGVGEIVPVDSQALADRPGELIPELMTAGSVVVLDEVWRFLPQGLTAKNVDPAWTTLFAEHGHRVDADGRMMQIVLVTQDLSQIAAFARSLVERTLVVTKLTVVGSSSRYRIDVYSGNVTGLKPPVSKRIGEEFGTYDKGIFACYVSRTMAEGSSSEVDESNMSSRGTLWRNPLIRYGMPAALICLIVGIWRVVQFFDPDAPAAVAHEEPRVVDRLESQPRGIESSASELGAMRRRVAAVLRGADDTESRVLLDYCDGRPQRWVDWYAARCVDAAEGYLACEYRGQRYEFHPAIDECRPQAEPRGAEVQWFPSDAGGSRESIPVIG